MLGVLLVSLARWGSRGEAREMVSRPAWPIIRGRGLPKLPAHRTSMRQTRQANDDIQPLDGGQPVERDVMKTRASASANGSLAELRAAARSLRAGLSLAMKREGSEADC